MEQPPVPSEDMRELMKRYDEMGLIKIVGDSQVTLTPLGIDTLFWLTFLLQGTLPDAHVRPVRRAKAKAEQFADAMAELRQFLHVQHNQN